MTDRTINLTDAESIVRHECGAWTGLAETIVRRFKKLPTVDAVPVSWIMSQVTERAERGTAFDVSVASILRTMVKEWKDETD